MAEDFVAHWEDRRAAMAKVLSTAENPSTPGKAMFVGVTREICARLYDEVVALRPDWHADALDRGRIKVVYSGTPSDDTASYGFRMSAIRQPAEAPGVQHDAASRVSSVDGADSHQPTGER